MKTGLDEEDGHVEMSNVTRTSGNAHDGSIMESDAWLKICEHDRSILESLTRDIPCSYRPSPLNQVLWDKASTVLRSIEPEIQHNTREQSFYAPADPVSSRRDPPNTILNYLQNFQALQPIETPSLDYTILPFAFRRAIWSCNQRSSLDRVHNPPSPLITVGCLAASVLIDPTVWVVVSNSSIIAGVVYSDEDMRQAWAWAFDVRRSEMTVFGTHINPDKRVHIKQASTISFLSVVSALTSPV